VALIKTGPIVSDIRGKAGGMVYSRGQGGAVVYAVPDYVWEDTPARIAARSPILNLSAAWSGTLTPLQRATWTRYAGQHPRPDRWGHPHPINGYCMFISINSYWYRDQQALRWRTAPTIAPLHPPVHEFEPTAATDTVNITLPPATYDPPPPGLILWHFAGYPRAGGVEYHRTPYRYTAKNIYVPPWSTTPWIVQWPWGFDVGQKLFSHLVAQDYATGAMSTLHQASVIAK